MGWVARLADPSMGSVQLQCVVGGNCWCGSFVDGVNDLRVVDAAQIHRGDREIGVPKLALDHQQRDALARHLARVRVTQLVWSEAPSHAGAARLARFCATAAATTAHAHLAAAVRSPLSLGAGPSVLVSPRPAPGGRRWRPPDQLLPLSPEERESERGPTTQVTAPVTPVLSASLVITLSLMGGSGALVPGAAVQLSTPRSAVGLGLG
jgi:hypothetical protein